MYVCQQLLDEQLSAKQGLYLAAFGTDVHPLWTSESPRIVNPAVYATAVKRFFFTLNFGKFIFGHDSGRHWLRGRGWGQLPTPP